MKKLTCLVLMLSLISFCSTNQDKVEKIYEDGVEVVLNHLEPYRIKGEAHTLTLDEEYIFDMERDDLAELGIGEIGGFDVNSDSNIYFMISTSSKDFIFKFDAKGNFLFSFGRKGQGPGELVAPRYLRVNELDQICVSDLGRRKLCLFENNGDFIEEMSLASNHRIATLLGNGKILAMKGSFNWEEGRLELPIILCNKDLEEIKMLHPGQWTPNFDLAKKINYLDLYMDYNVLRISNGLIYVGNYGSGYEFLIYDTQGNLQRKIRKEYHKVEVPAQLKEEILNCGKSWPPFEQIKEKVYFPKFHPPFQFFFLDDRSRLYVMTYEREKGPNGFMYDIFSPDGIFIGRTELDNYGSSLFSFTGIPVPLNVVVKNNRIYSLREKESGYKELVVYKVTWQ